MSKLKIVNIYTHLYIYLSIIILSIIILFIKLHHHISIEENSIIFTNSILGSLHAKKVNINLSQTLEIS